MSERNYLRQTVWRTCVPRGRHPKRLEPQGVEIYMHGINQDRMRKPGIDGHPFVFASGGRGTATWMYQ